MSKHENSLKPGRQPDETQEEYKERRARLTEMSKRAGHWGRLLHNVQAPKNLYKDPVTGDIKSKPYVRPATPTPGETDADA